MFKVIREFLDKNTGKMYKVGEEYKGSEGDSLTTATKFRPALVEKVADKAKAPVKEDAEKPTSKKTK